MFPSSENTHSQVVQLSLGVRRYTEHPIHMQTNVVKRLERMNIITMSGGQNSPLGSSIYWKQNMEGFGINEEANLWLGQSMAISRGE